MPYDVLVYLLLVRLCLEWNLNIAVLVASKNPLSLQLYIMPFKKELLNTKREAKNMLILNILFAVELNSSGYLVRWMFGEFDKNCVMTRGT